MSAYYPIVPKKKINRFVREVLRQGKIKVNSLEVNEGKLALLLMLTHKGLEGSLFSMDDALSNVGFCFNPCSTLDERYGGDKYYTFKKEDDIWVAMGDNCYGEDYTRVMITWKEKLDERTKEEFLLDQHNMA